MSSKPVTAHSSGTAIECCSSVASTPVAIWSFMHITARGSAPRRVSQLSTRRDPLAAEATAVPELAALAPFQQGYLVSAGEALDGVGARRRAADHTQLRVVMYAHEMP